MIQGDLLRFDLLTREIQHTDFVVLGVADPGGRVDGCRWHLDAGRQEIATALRRLAGQLEVVAKPDRSGIPAE